jgi:hypothetical protein
MIGPFVNWENMIGSTINRYRIDPEIRGLGCARVTIGYERVTTREGTPETQPGRLPFSLGAGGTKDVLWMPQVPGRVNTPSGLCRGAHEHAFTPCRTGPAMNPANRPASTVIRAPSRTIGPNGLPPERRTVGHDEGPIPAWPGAPIA